MFFFLLLLRNRGLSAFKGTNIPSLVLPGRVGGNLYWQAPCPFVCSTCPFFFMCVRGSVRAHTAPDGSGLFVADRFSLLTRPWVWWKERLLVEIPPFAIRRLCWSTLLRVIAHNVTSIDLGWWGKTAGEERISSSAWLVSYLASKVLQKASLWRRQIVTLLADAAQVSLFSQMSRDKS